MYLFYLRIYINLNDKCTFSKIYGGKPGRAHRKPLTASSLLLISNKLIAARLVTPGRKFHVRTYVEFIVQSPEDPLR